MADIHALPVKHKVGRRRVKPVLDAPVANVLRFSAPAAPRVETVEERVAKIELLLTQLARHMLETARVTRAICDLVRPH